MSWGVQRAQSPAHGRTKVAQVSGQTLGTGNTYSQGASSQGVSVGVESWAEPGQPAPQPLTTHW